VTPASWLVRLRQQYLAPVTLIRLVPISVVLVTGLVLTTWTHGLLSQHRTLVVHTHEVIETAKDVLIGLDDAETGQRGFLLSNEQRYLEPYMRAQDRLGAMAASLASQVSDNAEQAARVNRLAQLTRKKLDELRAAILARQAQGLDAAVAVMVASSDQATMDAIRHEIGRITEGEMALLRTRDAEVEADEHRMTVVAVLIGLASLLTRFAVEFYLTWRKRQSEVGQGA